MVAESGKALDLGKLMCLWFHWILSISRWFGQYVVC